MVITGPGGGGGHRATRRLTASTHRSTFQSVQREHLLAEREPDDGELVTRPLDDNGQGNTHSTPAFAAHRAVGDRDAVRGPVTVGPPATARAASA